MGLMDKIKNLFTEEVEDEVEVKEEPIKKEMIQVEIPSPAAKKETIEPEEPKQIIEPEKPKEEFKFPFFDDDDFEAIERKEKPKEEKRKHHTRKEYKEVYNPPKEEKKVFKPTPIISPVYGILDKNYQKEDIKNKNSKLRSYYDPKEASVDEIRNKAYGTLEDDIETTLFGRNHLIFDEEKEENIEETLDQMKEEKAPKEEYNDNIIGERPRHGSDLEPDITDLLQAEMDKETEKPHKISDSELFSMIDSMYQKGEKKDD